MSSTPTSLSPNWKVHVSKLAQDTNHQGSSLSSIRSALLFSTQEMLRFLESDTSLALLVDDENESLLVFHHFKSFTFSFPKQESKLVAIAALDNMATPVVINTASIKNYSQFVPMIDSFKNISSVTDLQHIEAREALALRNAIIIPLQVLNLSSHLISYIPET